MSLDFTLCTRITSRIRVTSRLRVAFAHDGEPDARLGLAAHALHRIVEAHALHRGVVQLDDEIAGLQPRPESRCVLDRRDHLDESVLHADLDAQAAELALGADLKLAERFLVQVGRMRIEPGEHAADRFGDELLVLDRLDIVVFDRAEHLGKGAQLVHRQRKARRLALSHGGEVEAEQDPRQHADQHQAGLFDLRRHRCSYVLPASAPPVGEKFHRAPQGSRTYYFRDTQRIGSKAFPSCRISKYKPDSVLPPLAPTVATTSPVRTGSPTCFSSDSLLP